MLVPLKQGLKQGLRYKWNGVWESLNVSSTKTRIETYSNDFDFGTRAQV